MIRIQAPNRGIALIGPGYYRPLANDEEVNNSGAIISKHVSGNDRQFDLWVSMAIQGNIAGGVADIVRTESRPLKFYQEGDDLFVYAPNGKSWKVPSDAYRVLLIALGLAGPHIVRTIPENERQFMELVLTATADSAAASVEITDEDAAKIAAKIGGGATADQVQSIVNEAFASLTLRAQ